MKGTKYASSAVALRNGTITWCVVQRRVMKGRVTHAEAMLVGLWRQRGGGFGPASA